MSNIVHKVKEAVSGHHDKHSQSTNAGPHDSNIVNKADPRVDSDRDHRAAHSAAGTTGGAYDTTTTGYTGTTGTTGTTGVGYDNPRSTNAGPHDSNLANKMDPRIDSDRSQYGTGMNTGTTTGTTTGGLSSGGVYDNTQSTNAGPHDSNLANKMDPRVDSDRSQYGTGVTTGTTMGTTTGGLTSGDTYDNPRSTNVGPHSSNMANKVDPRVDSDMDNRARHQEMGSYGSATAGNSYNTPGSGNAQKTAGPHDSNLANKLDPRVDSDLDGSRTVGGNATHY